MKKSMLLLFGLLLLLVGCHSGDTLSRETRELMGTEVTVMIWEQQSQNKGKQGIDAAFDEIARIDSVFSNYKPESPISQINRAAGKNAVKIDAEVMAMLQKAKEYAAESGGVFDITYASAGKLYDWKAKTHVIPDEATVKAAMARVGIEKLVLDSEAMTARLAEEGDRIDVGGYIKGYAVDRAAMKLRELGFSDFIVNAGGDMYVAGHKGKKSWKIGIRDPRGARDDLLATLSVKDKAVVTSGDYERFFMKDGVRYHHIIDTRTGRPAMASRSVTVIADSCMNADYLSTTVFILGAQAGIELIEKKYPGAEAMVIDSDGKWHFSEHFKSVGDFELVENGKE